MADLLESIRRELHERLETLRPLVGEYERLQAAEQALTSAGSSPARKAGGEPRTAAPRRAGRSSPTRRASSPAERAATREKVLAIVSERPGVTKAELKAAARLSSAGVAQNLRRLIEGGEIREETLPGGETGYRAADAAPGAAAVPAA